MKNQNIRAIIFDFDGTLADTLDAIRAAVNNTLRHFGHPEKAATSPPCHRGRARQ